MNFAANYKKYNILRYKFFRKANHPVAIKNTSSLQVFFTAWMYG